MASTYSPSLRIELIGAGEQAGTWNTTTNSNLGTIIESAIAGYVSVSVTSANQAFTALDGAPDQARNAVIALTTTTTANFAVYAPPQEKQYIIWNNTAYTATVYNSTSLGNTIAAGTGVVIPAGKKFVIFTTGVNFYIVDASAASFSGVLPVLNGGTGVTTSTGTGNTVLSNSPTLVTPALGTPTSGGLVNCTGLPIVNGTFGILSVLRGGTGTAASTGSDNVVLSTSPTLVTPILGTPQSVNLTNGTALPISSGTTGTLPVSRGGTGVTTSTGTGNTVLSTSPTLVTPALGTPSSGTLDNCTSNTESFGTSNTQLATTAFVQAALQALHPVGSIYTSTSATNPNTSFGFGTWVQFGAGRVMLGVGGAFGAGTTGGNNDAVVVSHTHSATSSVSDPSHNHPIQFQDGIVFAIGAGSGTHRIADGQLYGNGQNIMVSTPVTTGITVATTNASTGSSATNANLPPYIVVYMWNRTA